MLHPTVAQPAARTVPPALPGASVIEKRPINVGMAQLGCGGGSDEFVIYGLGSCIGLVLWSPARKCGSLAHIVLPASRGMAYNPATPAKYADWAVPRSIDMLLARGARREDMVARLVGGAHPLAAALTSEVGRQNSEVTLTLLRVQGIRVAKTSLGGVNGRTIRFAPGTGVLEVKQVNGNWERL